MQITMQSKLVLLRFGSFEKANIKHKIAKPRH